MHPNEEQTYTVRSLFVIDPDKKVRLTITYPRTVGRNFEEILRVIDSLQLTETYKVSTPVNRRMGEDVIILPSAANEAAKAMFPSGWTDRSRI